MRRYLFLMTFLHSIICTQNIELRNTENQFDYVIITVDDYISVCEIFKTHKEINNEFNLLITTKDDILAEFNNNISIQSNIREFISFAGKSWADPKPNYFLFAADLDSIPNFSFRSIESEIFENYDTSHSDYYYGVDMSS